MHLHRQHIAVKAPVVWVPKVAYNTAPIDVQRRQSYNYNNDKYSIICISISYRSVSKFGGLLSLIEYYGTY